MYSLYSENAWNYHSIDIKDEKALLFWIEKYSVKKYKRQREIIFGFIFYIKI